MTSSLTSRWRALDRYIADGGLERCLFEHRVFEQRAFDGRARQARTVLCVLPFSVAHVLGDDLDGVFERRVFDRRVSEQRAFERRVFEQRAFERRVFEQRAFEGRA